MKLHEVETLAKETMSAHGLLEQRWAFAWLTRGSRALGRCEYASKTIRLLRSSAELDERDNLEQILLHEVAHALTPGAHHGAAWLARA